MQKTAQQSLLDLLLRLMPEWGKEVTIIRRKPTVDRRAAKALYSIWLDAKNKLSQNEFKLPKDCDDTDLQAMVNAGLVKEKKGRKLEVTAKGVEVIKTMLLGDERSAYEDDGSIMDYMTAHANTIPRMRKTGKIAANISGGGWWTRMKIAGQWSEPFQGGEGSWSARIMDYSNKGPLFIVTMRNGEERRAMYDLLTHNWKIIA